jgi:hypothetical protein
MEAGPHQAERAGSDTDHACIISYSGKGASPLQKGDNFWSGDAEVLITTGYLVLTVKVATAGTALLPLLVRNAPAGSLLQ